MATLEETHRAVLSVAEPSSASRQKSDYPSSVRSSVLRVAGRRSAKNACDGKRTPRLLIDPTTRQHLQRPDRDRWLRFCRQSQKTYDLTSTTGRTHLRIPQQASDFWPRAPHGPKYMPIDPLSKVGGGSKGSALELHYPRLCSSMALCILLLLTFGRRKTSSESRVG